MGVVSPGGEPALADGLKCWVFLGAESRQLLLNPLSLLEKGVCGGCTRLWSSSTPASLVCSKRLDLAEAHRVLRHGKAKKLLRFSKLKSRGEF